MPFTKFLEEKWRKAFRFFDIDKDGVVSKEDFQQLAAHIGERSGATAEEKVKITEEWVKWAELLHSYPGQIISENVWVQHGHILHKDPENHARLVADTYSTVFDTIDLNKDGLISYDEFKIYYEGFGCKDERFIRKVFEQLDINKDGYIERDELVTAEVSYFVNDENDKYSFMYDPAAV